MPRSFVFRVYPAARPRGRSVGPVCPALCRWRGLAQPPGLPTRRSSGSVIADENVEAGIELNRFVVEAAEVLHGQTVYSHRAFILPRINEPPYGGSPLQLTSPKWPKLSPGPVRFSAAATAAINRRKRAHRQPCTAICNGTWTDNACRLPSSHSTLLRPLRGRVGAGG